MKALAEKLKGASPYAYLIPCFAIFAMFLFLSLCEDHLPELLPHR